MRVVVVGVVFYAYFSVWQSDWIASWDDSTNPAKGATPVAEVVRLVSTRRTRRFTTRHLVPACIALGPKWVSINSLITAIAARGTSPDSRVFIAAPTMCGSTERLSEEVRGVGFQPAKR